jgi:hypothetical protein
MKVHLTNQERRINKEVAPIETQTKNAQVSWDDSGSFELKPNTQFLIHFKNIKTSLPSGNAPITFLFKNIEGYKDRFYDINVKRGLAQIFYKDVNLDGLSKIDGEDYKYQKLLTSIPKSKEYYFTEYKIEGKKPYKVSIEPVGIRWKIIVETTKKIIDFKESILKLRFVHYSMTNKVIKVFDNELMTRINHYRMYIANEIMFVRGNTTALKTGLSLTFQFENQADYRFFLDKKAYLFVRWLPTGSPESYLFDRHNDDKLEVYKTITTKSNTKIPNQNSQDGQFFIAGIISDINDHPNKDIYAKMTLVFDEKVKKQTLELKNIRVPVLAKKPS